MIIVIGVFVKDMIMKAINRCSATITHHNEKLVNTLTYIVLSQGSAQIEYPWKYKLFPLLNMIVRKPLTAKPNNFIDQHL